MISALLIDATAFNFRSYVWEVTLIEAHTLLCKNKRKENNFCIMYTKVFINWSREFDLNQNFQKLIAMRFKSNVRWIDQES